MNDSLAEEPNGTAASRVRDCKPEVTANQSKISNPTEENSVYFPHKLLDHFFLHSFLIKNCEESSNGSLPSEYPCKCTRIHNNEHREYIDNHE